MHEHLERGIFVSLFSDRAEVKKQKRIILFIFIFCPLLFSGVLFPGHWPTPKSWNSKLACVFLNKRNKQTNFLCAVCTVCMQVRVCVVIFFIDLGGVGFNFFSICLPYLALQPQLISSHLYQLCRVSIFRFTDWHISFNVNSIMTEQILNPQTPSCTVLISLSQTV